MVLPILIYPNPKLKLKSRSISQEEILNPKTQKFIKDLGETMMAKQGLGLAAPQFGNPIQIITINPELAIQDENKPFVLINPKITYHSLRKEILEEGCLSIPDVYGKVKRSKIIRLKYQDKKGEKRKLKATSLLACVIQHEIDHLEGILFIDKIIEKSS